MPYIKEAAYLFILNAARNVYPEEFIGLLRGEKEKDLITEILVLPGSTYGEGFSSLRYSSIPIDHTIIGSIHSHPSKNNKPSKQDLVYFRKTGKYHIITRHPYHDLSDLACYDIHGERLDLWLIE